MPRFLKSPRNRWILDFVATRYGVKTPSDYLGIRDESVVFQVDQLCAETGIAVEGYLQETEEQRDPSDRKKKIQVPKYTLDQVLSPDFNPNAFGKKSYRSTQTKKLEEDKQAVSVDADDLE